MKRLFTLTKSPNHKTDLFFPDKPKAKAKRDELNAPFGDQKPYHVSKGPDHWKQNTVAEG